MTLNLTGLLWELTDMTGVNMLCYMGGAGHLKLYFLLLLFQEGSLHISSSESLLVLLPTFKPPMWS